MAKMKLTGDPWPDGSTYYYMVFEREMYEQEVASDLGPLDPTIVGDAVIALEIRGGPGVLVMTYECSVDEVTDEMIHTVIIPAVAEMGFSVGQPSPRSRLHTRPRRRR